MLNVGIVGAGEGGTSILKTLLSVDDINIFGICDKNPDAPGIKMANKSGIPVFNDFLDLINFNEEKIIIEVTGNDKIRNSLLSNADDKTKIVDSSVALLIFKIVNSRESIIKELEEESAKLADLASDLSASIQETSATSKENSENLDKTVNNLINTANQNKENIDETNQIINFIKKVSNQTKMLGFNAAIEANRAGVEGNGFRVVANEIRKLADETNESVQQITHFINELNNSTKNTILHIQDLQNQSNKFLSVQDKISDTLINVADQIMELSTTLEKLSNR